MTHAERISKKWDNAANRAFAAREDSVIVPARIVIGVDPGIRGGIAAIELAEDGNKRLVCGIPRYDKAACLRFIRSMKLNKCIVYVEEVHAMPRQGVSSMFTFGREVGFWEGLFFTLDIPTHFVTPQVWQKATIAAMAGRDTKERSVRFALATFGNEAAGAMLPPRAKKPHDGIADAICIAWYGAAALHKG